MQRDHASRRRGTLAAAAIGGALLIAGVLAA